MRVVEIGVHKNRGLKATIENVEDVEDELEVFPDPPPEDAELVGELTKRLSEREWANDKEAKRMLSDLSHASASVRWIEDFCGLHRNHTIIGTKWDGPFTWPCDILPRVRASILQPKEFSPYCLVEFARRSGLLHGLALGRRQRFPGQFIAAAAMALPRSEGEADAAWNKKFSHVSNFELDFGKTLYRTALSVVNSMKKALGSAGICSFCSHCFHVFIPRRWGKDLYCSPKCREAEKANRKLAQEVDRGLVPMTAYPLWNLAIHRNPGNGFGVFGATRNWDTETRRHARYPLGQLRDPQQSWEYDIGPRITGTSELPKSGKLAKTELGPARRVRKSLKKNKK